MTGRFGRFLRQNTIAILALFVALSGTTFAATTALGKNTVGAKQLKKNAVTNVKIKNGAVTNAKIANNAVTGAKVRNDSLTGADILESSLGKVSSATAADSATNATSAGALNGYAANGLTRVAVMSTSDTTPIDQSPLETTYGTPLSITAPAAGFVLINGSYSVKNVSLGCTTNCIFWGRIRHIEDGTYSRYNESDVTGLGYQTGSMSSVFPVSAGVNTFDLRFARNTGTLSGTIEGWFAEVNAIYSPFGSTGGSTLGPASSTRAKAR